MLKASLTPWVCRFELALGVFTVCGKKPRLDRGKIESLWTRALAEGARYKGFVVSSGKVSLVKPLLEKKLKSL